jgi:peroxiredoxin Q/BCP
MTAGCIQAQPAAELKPGDPAPAFALQGSDGRTYRLEDFRGKQAVVLAWFPKAFTGG